MINYELFSKEAIYGTFELLGLETSEKREKFTNYGISTSTTALPDKKNGNYSRFSLSYNTEKSGD
ncbi:hypothetical protein [Peribacillus sp. Hz7]|uniref:hypothetical protein n=1 Tax=Peribacillus sp. Hz7 TaxID=3344873 RepID=UPI0035C9CF11